MKLLLCLAAVCPLVALAAVNVHSEREKKEKLLSCLEFSHHLKREAVVFKTPIDEIIETFGSAFLSGATPESLPSLLDELVPGRKCSTIVKNIMSASSAEVELRCEELVRECEAAYSENEEKSKGRKAVGVLVPVFAALLAVIIML